MEKITEVRGQCPELEQLVQFEGPAADDVLTHGNIRADLAMVAKRMPQDGHEVYFVFLPLAHVLTRAVQFMALTAGAQLVYWKRGPATLLDEIAAARPTHLPSVPRCSRRSTPPRRRRSPRPAG